jgi:uncharacterized membrane protein YfcA
MKDLDPMVFLAVFAEMLGALFVPMALLAAAGVAALAFTVARDRGINSRRLVQAELAGFAGGFVGIWAALQMTSSALDDILGGPIDWLFAIALWTGGAVGVACAAYVVLGLIEKRTTAAARQ